MNGRHIKLCLISCYLVHSSLGSFMQLIVTTFQLPRLGSLFFYNISARVSFSIHTIVHRGCLKSVGCFLLACCCAYDRTIHWPREVYGGSYIWPRGSDKQTNTSLIDQLSCTPLPRCKCLLYTRCSYTCNRGNLDTVYSKEQLMGPLIYVGQ